MFYNLWMQIGHYKSFVKCSKIIFQTYTYRIVFEVGMTYIQIHVFSIDSMHRLLSECFATLAMILAIMIIPEADIRGIVVKFAKDKISSLKII